MTKITPEPYTVCDFCGKVIDEEIRINQWAPSLNHNGVKYDLCCLCDTYINEAIEEVKERRFERKETKVVEE